MSRSRKGTALGALLAAAALVVSGCGSTSVVSADIMSRVSSTGTSRPGDTTTVSR